MMRIREVKTSESAQIGSYPSNMLIIEEYLIAYLQVDITQHRRT